VRPTAFFKSLAGQIELVKTGKPYVMFGDGNLASCKPISEQDLARFMADCITGGCVCVRGCEKREREGGGGGLFSGLVVILGRPCVLVFAAGNGHVKRQMQ
jgi:hypothetical protein